MAGGRIARGLALGAPVAGASSAALASWVTARRITAPGRREKRFLTPWELGISYEEVAFKTKDGLLLRGWWLPAPQPKWTVISLHGHRGARHHCVGVGAALWRRGANVLLFDHRGRGSSEGDLMSLGYYEALDALAAIGYSFSRAPEVSLGLIGYSMGAAVAVIAPAQEERGKAIAAVSPLPSARDNVRILLRRVICPPHAPAGALTVQIFP